MGLGKSVQAIAFVSALLGPYARAPTIIDFFKRGTKDPLIPAIPHQPPPEPVLFVVPASVIEQWVREFFKWLKLPVDVFHGPDRSETMTRVQKGKVRVLIASYETFRIHIEKINTIKWNCIFFDEIHKIKNRSSLSSKCCKNLTTQRRFGLTGTVMQNNFEELWTLIDFVCPGYLGSLEEFRRLYVAPIKTGQRHGALFTEVTKGRSCAKRLARRLQQIILRRDKSVISSILPGKDDNVVFCKLTPLQVKCYQRLLSSPVYSNLSDMCTHCECNSGLSVADCKCVKFRHPTPPLPIWKLEALPAIIRLQKIANRESHSHSHFHSHSHSHFPPPSSSQQTFY